jgi:hypothetical protein
MSADKTMLPDRVVRKILGNEQSPVRFEQFCCELLTDEEGYTFMPTSRSYDLARDGRTLPDAAGNPGFLCCSTEDDIDDKAETDVTRLLKFAKPRSIYFCSTRDKSELKVNRIETRLKELAPDIPRIAALGADQLVALVRQHPASFERRYAAELIEERGFFKDGSLEKLQLQVTGLQVALSTQFQEDAQTLRSETLRTLVLNAIADGKGWTIARLAKSMSDALHLPQIINEQYFTDILNKLSREKAIQVQDGVVLVQPELGAGPVRLRY